MVSILPVLSLLALLSFIMAETFQANCVVSNKRDDRGGSDVVSRGRDGNRENIVKGKKSTTPGFYGVTTDTVDVVIKATTPNYATIFLNGETASGASSNCQTPAQLAKTLKAGDVISFDANSKPNTHSAPTYGFYGAILAADGSKVYSTTGQSGWKVKLQIEAEDGWMYPGYDDSDWYDLSNVSPLEDCNIQPFTEAGAACTWFKTAPGSIFVRYVVPTTSCACTEGNCTTGTCDNCLYNMGNGRLICYKGWSEQQCNAGGNAYHWCGI